MAELRNDKKAIFFDRMSLMLENSLNPKEVFEYLAEEFSDLSGKLKTCAKKVDDGVSMITAMDSVKLLSSNEKVTLAAAEASGDLPFVLKMLSEFCETSSDQMREVRQQTIPNVFYLLAAACVMYGMMLTIVPSIGENIPDRKRAEFVVFMISDAVVNFHSQYFELTLVALACLAAWILRYFSTAAGKQSALSFLLVTPIIKKGIVCLTLGLWSKQASTMIKSGITFAEVVDMTAKMLPQQLSSGLIRTKEDVIKQGWNTALNKSKWHPEDSRLSWPPEVFGALKAGGDTGRLEVTLENLSKGLLKTSARTIEKATSVFATATFLIAAAAVAAVVLSVLMATLSGIS